MTVAWGKATVHESLGGSVPFNVPRFLGWALPMIFRGAVLRPAQLDPEPVVQKAILTFHSTQAKPTNQQPARVGEPERGPSPSRMGISKARIPDKEPQHATHTSALCCCCSMATM